MCAMYAGACLTCLDIGTRRGMFGSTKRASGCRALGRSLCGLACEGEGRGSEGAGGGGWWRGGGIITKALKIQVQHQRSTSNPHRIAVHLHRSTERTELTVRGPPTCATQRFSQAWRLGGWRGFVLSRASMARGGLGGALVLCLVPWFRRCSPWGTLS